VSGTTARTFTLDVNDVGVHTINVWIRESGMSFDKMVITNDPNYIPAGLGPDPSPFGSNELPTALQPVVTPGDGVYFESVAITMSTDTPGASIYYTLDGSIPTTSSNLYTGEFALYQNASLTAAAFKDGYNRSVLTKREYNVLVPPPELTHYWRFDEAQGATSFADLTGGLNAQCTNCPASVIGNINSGLQFNGTTHEASVPANVSFDWTANSSVSFELWIQKDTACATPEVILGRNDELSGLQWWVGCENDKAAFHLIDTNGDGSGAGAIGTTNITDGNWHHIVAIHDGFSNENSLYVDGTLEATASVAYTGSFASAVADVNIGWLNSSTTDYHFSGVIDEIAIYDRVLAKDQIDQHVLDGTLGLHRGFYGGIDPIKIMPLGDSITARTGYRPNLYFKLSDAGYFVDFVGNGSDAGGLHDRDHEGHSGYTPAQIAASLNTWLSTTQPEVILLHIGTNELDLLGVEDILNIIDAFDPNITVVLARIINRATYDQATTDFNVALESMAQDRINQGDKIIIVDHESALDYAVDMSDNLHPDASGFRKMATVWFEGLLRFIPNTLSVTPQIYSTPVTTANLGANYQYQVVSIGFPSSNFQLLDAPSGMVIHPDTGFVSWTPTVSGTFNVTIEAANSTGSATQSFSIVVN
jgi:hypothetical protein